MMPLLPDLSTIFLAPPSFVVQFLLLLLLLLIFLLLLSVNEMIKYINFTRKVIKTDD
jgi:hypothetical protein